MNDKPRPLFWRVIHHPRFYAFSFVLFSAWTVEYAVEDSGWLFFYAFAASMELYLLAEWVRDGCRRHVTITEQQWAAEDQL